MIRLEKLTKEFGTLQAVDNLDLTIDDGEIFSLLGPNGAGKTTTIKMLTGLLHPTTGRMLLDGIDDYILRHGKSKTVCFAMINHPKMMFQPQFDLLAELIGAMQKKYQGRISFATSAQILTHDTGKAGKEGGP